MKLETGNLKLATLRCLVALAIAPQIECALESSLRIKGIATTIMEILTRDNKIKFDKNCHPWIVSLIKSARRNTSIKKVQAELIARALCRQWNPGLGDWAIDASVTQGVKKQ